MKLFLLQKFFPFYLFTLCKRWRQYYTFTLFLRHCLQQHICLTASLYKPIESRVHMVTKGEEPIHVGNRSATVNYGASLFTAWAKLLILIVASEKLPVVAIILVFMYFRFSFADWHSVISSLNTTYGTIVTVNWRKFQIAHFTNLIALGHYPCLMVCAVIRYSGSVQSHNYLISPVNVDSLWRMI